VSRLHVAIIVLGSCPARTCTVWVHQRLPSHTEPRHTRDVNFGIEGTPVALRTNFHCNFSLGGGSNLFLTGLQSWDYISNRPGALRLPSLPSTVGLKKSVCTGHPTNFPPPNTHSSNIYFSAIILAIKVKVVLKESQEDTIQYLVYQPPALRTASHQRGIESKRPPIKSISITSHTSLIHAFTSSLSTLFSFRSLNSGCN